MLTVRLNRGQTVAYRYPYTSSNSLGPSPTAIVFAPKFAIYTHM